MVGSNDNNIIIGPSSAEDPKTPKQAEINLATAGDPFKQNQKKSVVRLRRRRRLSLNNRALPLQSLAFESVKGGTSERTIQAKLKRKTTTTTNGLRIKGEDR